jgi:hypothetical protein
MGQPTPSKVPPKTISDLDYIWLKETFFFFLFFLQVFTLFELGAITSQANHTIPLPIKERPGGLIWCIAL